ncbi:unnamed protein product [Didymodactylos carnosus]|uniref:HTH cro/C1-type domain-containing protein n=1 Tax=Didymodactylos carnosus TaxID=1234261 RepID=A0A8S2G9H7_9BILA|nr:unnamed protein product [Didymodactylos carnosus]CAF4508904.1 unnamed protein product [Didymodactylos carnosus]
MTLSTRQTYHKDSNVGRSPKKAKNKRKPDAGGKKKKRPISSDKKKLRIAKLKVRRLRKRMLLRTRINRRSKPNSNSRLLGFKKYNSKDVSSKQTALANKVIKNNTIDRLRIILSSRTDYLRALSRASKVSRKRIQHFLAGDRKVTLDTIGRIADALGLRLIMVHKRQLFDQNSKHNFFTIA